MIEHVEDFEFFIKELERISSKGYIELPSRLGDNLVFENEKDHLWWFIYDDVNNSLIASKKNQNLEPFLTVSTAKLFEDIYRESLVIELLWEKEINLTIDESIGNKNFTKISFLQIVRKYLSKKLRTVIRKK